MGLGTEKFQCKLSPGGSLREVSFQKDWPAMRIEIHTGPAEGKSKPVLAARLECRMRPRTAVLLEGAVFCQKHFFWKILQSGPVLLLPVSSERRTSA